LIKYNQIFSEFFKITFGFSPAYDIITGRKKLDRGELILLKIRRNERIAAMTRILCSHPNQSYTLQHFSDLFNSGKSTVCEDIAIIRDSLLAFKLGDLETTAGAGGGVRFVPLADMDRTRKYIRELCLTLSDSNRILPGGYLYMNDILHSPQQIHRIGEILAARFLDLKPDFILTVETKGTPVAIMTAFELGCPVVVASRNGLLTEGPLVSINYVSASSQRIQTMSLSKRSVREGSRALIIDDFMKGGGTVKGMIQLLKEFNVEIAGTGVVIATRQPREKMVSDYTALMVLEEVNEEENRVKLSPADWVCSV
jgi:purine operon repressor